MKMMVKLNIAYLVLLLGTAGPSFSKNMYRWVDENGVVHYSDTVPDKSTVKDQKVEGRLGVESADEKNEADVRKKEIEDYNEKVREYNREIAGAYEQAVREVEASGTTENRERKEEILADIEKLRRISEENARVREMNSKALKEYDDRRMEIEKQNEEIREHNNKVLADNDSLRHEYEARLKKLEEDKAQGRIEEESDAEKQMEEYRKRILQIEERNNWAIQQNEKIREQNERIKREFEEKKKEIEAYNARIQKMEQENLSRLEKLKEQ